MLTSFHLSSQKTSLKQECMAGFTTFITMVYILFVAAHWLNMAGLPFHEAYILLASLIALGCMLMGLFANYPAAVAPGLGLLTYFTAIVIRDHHMPYQQAISAVFIAGILFFIFTITPLRRLLIAAIPDSLASAIAAGIGGFIGFIALKQIGLIVSNQLTLVQLGPLHSHQIALFLLGFFLILYLDHRKIKGSIIISILVVSMIHYLINFHAPKALTSSAQLWQHFHFSFLWTSPSWWATVLTFLLLTTFDSTSTLLSFNQQLKQLHCEVKPQQFKRALVAESIISAIAPAFGITTFTPLVESAAGIQAGGRTGLTACVVGLLFLLMLPLYQLAHSIPNAATSAVLMYIACLMMKPLANVNWQDPVLGIPAAITFLLMPLSNSITNGIGFGLTCYVILASTSGRWRQIPPILWACAVLFVGYFVFQGN